MNRRAFISAAFSGLAAAALGMPTQLRGPVVIRDTSWPSTPDHFHRLRVEFAQVCGVSQTLLFGRPPEPIKDFLDREWGKIDPELRRRCSGTRERLANLHLRGL